VHISQLVVDAGDDSPEGAYPLNVQMLLCTEASSSWEEGGRKGGSDFIQPKRAVPLGIGS